MSDRDFRTKRARKALRDFCQKYCDRLSLFEAELMILAIRAGSMVAALEEIGVAKRKIKGILRAARELDEKLSEK